MKQTSVVTGASGGIGRWIALGLAGAGHHVVLVCRDAARGESVRRWIGERVPGGSTEVRVADLALLESTRRVGDAIAAAHPRLGLLLNNAGAFTARRQFTAEGHDTVVAVNHLSPYVLTDTLEAALRAGAPARIVNVGSSTSDNARINADDLELARGWSMVRAYGGSKLAMMMSTFARAARLQGSGVVANVVHPGTVASGLIRERGAIGLAWRMMAPFVLTEEQGAETPLRAALAAEWAGVSGVYIKRRGAARPNRRALDPSMVAAVEAATRALVEAAWTRSPHLPHEVSAQAGNARR